MMENLISTNSTNQAFKLEKPKCGVAPKTFPRPTPAHSNDCAAGKRRPGRHGGKGRKRLLPALVPWTREEQINHTVYECIQMHIHVGSCTVLEVFNMFCFDMIFIHTQILQRFPKAPHHPTSLQVYSQGLKSHLPFRKQRAASSPTVLTLRPANYILQAARRPSLGLAIDLQMAGK